MNKYILPFFIFGLFYSCQSDQKNKALTETLSIESVASQDLHVKRVETDENVSETGNSEQTTFDNNVPINKKKIIKDGSISVKTKDINEGKKNIDYLLKQLNAYYETEDLQNDDQRISYNLRARIPAENFEKLITTLENGKDEIQSKSIQARDVTEEFVDIESRLKNKREYLNKYMSLLNRASTIKDILAIEENIRIIQEEIESREGRLKYLTDQVSFSTLNINLYSEKEYVYKPEQEDNFSERVKKALSGEWKSIVELLLWMVAIWPFMIIGILGVFVFRRFRRKKNKV